MAVEMGGPAERGPRRARFENTSVQLIFLTDFNQLVMSTDKERILSRNCSKIVSKTLILISYLKLNVSLHPRRHCD